MSFAYLPLYTGDYLRDTQHLSCSEHGIYLKFLIHCWDQKGPLPLDERKQHSICNARSGDEIEAMRRVRSEFFTEMTDGWYNRRMQLEIERAENISAARSDAGKRGYQARVKQLPSKRKAIVSSLTPTPILNPMPSPPSAPETQPLPPWLPVEAWNSYVDHRRAKRAKLTPKARELAIKTLEKLRSAGHNVVEVINQSIAQGWTGLFELKNVPGLQAGALAYLSQFEDKDERNE